MYTVAEYIMALEVMFLQTELMIWEFKLLALSLGLTASRFYK